MQNILIYTIIGLVIYLLLSPKKKAFTVHPRDTVLEFIGGKLLEVEK